MSREFKQTDTDGGLNDPLLNVHDEGSEADLMADDLDFMTALDKLFREEFGASLLEGDEDERDFAARNPRPISELEQVVLALETLNRKHQVMPLSHEDLDDLEDLMDEMYFVRGAFYGHGFVKLVDSLVERAELACGALRNRPAWAEKQRVTEVPGMKELELLRKNGFYAVGVPHQIDKLEQPYTRTLDIVRLVMDLMQREGDPVCLLVANMPTTTRTPEEARLIGLKDLLFYEALQDLLIDMDPEGKRGLKRLPVILMSDVDKLPGFAERRTAVENLFEVNPDFREAVYACVPRQLRHRKHHDKTWTQLESLENKAALELARSRVLYVFDQVSKVSSIGGKKWGHEREQPYDHATAMADELLGVAHEARSTFEYIKAEGSIGDIPYRAAAGLNDPMDIPGLLSSFGHMENQQNRLALFANQRREPIDQVVALLQKAENDLKEKRTVDPVDKGEVSNLEAWHAKLLEVVQVMVASYAVSVLKEHHRLAEPIAILDELLIALRHKFIDQLVKNTKISPGERRQVEEIYMKHTQKEAYLAKEEGVIVMDYVLMKRMGIFAVLREEAPYSIIAEQSHKWLPVVAVSPKEDSPYDYIPRVVSGLLFGPGAPYEDKSTRSDIEIAERPEAQWTLPHGIFEKLLFSEIKHPGPPRTAAEATAALDSLIETPQKIRWRSFDDFIEAIEGTPVEFFYRALLSMAVGLPPPHLEPLPIEFVQSEQATRIREILNRPCFNENFRKDFLFILSSQ